jgi:DNA-binding CsgD family transcriptional regulator
MTVGGGAVGAFRGSQGPGAELFRRPAELVEVSEVIYRRIFAVGLWVAVGATTTAMLSAVLEPAGSRLSGLIACSICLVALVCAAKHPAGLYGQLRRRPRALLATSAVLGAGAYGVGRENYELFLPIITVIGVCGIATSLRIVIAAGTIATAGFGAPQLITGHANLAPAMAVLVPPVMFWLIVERIADFTLHLRQALEVGHGRRRTLSKPPAAPDAHDPTPSRPGGRRSHRPLRLLSSPRAIVVGGQRLTTRQLQVVLLACEGLRHAEIGACLGIGPQQVRRHLGAARERTDSSSTPQLISWARRNGLTPRSPSAGHHAENPVAGPHPHNCT